MAEYSFLVHKNALNIANSVDLFQKFSHK